MNRKKSKVQSLRNKLEGVRDPRELFTYLLQRAHLWPEPGLWPEEGPLRRVVLFSHAFQDRVVDLLEQVPSVPAIITGLEELRLVATKITPKGIARLRKLMPEVEVIAVLE